MKYGICPKCAKRRRLTKHHIFPKRHFGKGGKNKEVVLICRECHDKLEGKIPFNKQEDEFYPKIVEVFLGLENKNPLYQ